MYFFSTAYYISPSNLFIACLKETENQIFMNPIFGGSAYCSAYNNNKKKCLIVDVDTQNHSIAKEEN